MVRSIHNRRVGVIRILRQSRLLLWEWVGVLCRANTVPTKLFMFPRYGQKLGRVQGVGYVNELLARLTGQPVQDETQTNHTLDDSPITFPLDRTFYADFTHDDEMISIYGALGLFVQPDDLDPTQPDEGRTWVASKMVPFSGRMITEKLSCNGTETGNPGEYVRVFVNDAIQPLAFCGARGDGLCTLANFVESQSYARNNGEGDWALYFVGEEA